VCGVEDHQVVRVADRQYELRHAVEQGRLLGARRHAGDLDLTFHLRAQVLGRDTHQVGLDAVDVLRRGLLGVDLEGPEVLGDPALLRAELALEDVAGGVRGVGGDEQGPPARLGGEQREGGGGGGLAHSAFAAEEEDPAVEPVQAAHRVLRRVARGPAGAPVVNIT